MASHRANVEDLSTGCRKNSLRSVFFFFTVVSFLPVIEVLEALRPNTNGARNGRMGEWKEKLYR